MLKPLFRLPHASWNSWLTTSEWATCLDGRIMSSMLGSLDAFSRWKKTGSLVSGILQTLLSPVSICQWLFKWQHDSAFRRAQMVEDHLQIAFIVIIICPCASKPSLFWHTKVQNGARYKAFHRQFVLLQGLNLISFFSAGKNYSKICTYSLEQCCV